MTTLRNSETGIEFVGPVTNKLRETETGIEFAATTANKLRDSQAGIEFVYKIGVRRTCRVQIVG